MARKPAATKAARRAKKETASPAVSRETSQIETWAIDRLKPYARNSRTHSKDQVARIAKSIQRFGFTNPILVSEDGTIIAGHGRTEAAKSLGMTAVPVIVASGWTLEERKAYVIADNKLALDAGWDEEILRLELGELTEANFDLDLTGFGEEDLNKLFGRVAEQVAPDTAPQLTGLTFSVVVRCSDEQHQSELLERLAGEGLKCEALIS